MARFFIDRPVFAMVIAIIIVILGGVAIPSLPIATYPELVPPVVQITSAYLGGNAADLEKTVAQPIEEQLVGLDGMLYFLTSCSNNGSMTIAVTFKLGTNPDTATVQTQNRVSLALPRLPAEVQRTGGSLLPVLRTCRRALDHVRLTHSGRLCGGEHRCRICLHRRRHEA